MVDSKRFPPRAGMHRGGGASALLFGRDLSLIANRHSPEFRLQRTIELAVTRMGSAAAVARALDVTSATVSQWRSRRKHPDAINFIRLQDLASAPPRKLVRRPSVQKGASTPTERET